MEKVSIEEELRARTQLLTRLSHALPVGLFEIDTSRRIKFTNDRLHVIAGLPPAATIEAQLMTVVDDDQAILQAALWPSSPTTHSMSSRSDPSTGWRTHYMSASRAVPLGVARPVQRGHRRLQDLCMACENPSSGTDQYEVWIRVERGMFVALPFCATTPDPGRCSPKL